MDAHLERLAARRLAPGTLMRASGMAGLRPSMQPASVTTTSVAAAYSVPSLISATATMLLRAGEADARVDLDALDRRPETRTTAMSGTGLTSEKRRIARTYGPGANGPSTTIRIGTAWPLSASRGSVEAHALAARRCVRRGTPSSAGMAGSRRRRRAPAAHGDERPARRTLQQAPPRAKSRRRVRSSQRREIGDDVLDLARGQDRLAARRRAATRDEPVDLVVARHDRRAD